MKKLVLAASIVTLGSTAAYAEDKKWSGEGELGYTTSSTAANTESSSLVAKLGLNYKNGAWGNQLKVENIRTKTTSAPTLITPSVTSKTADRATFTDKLTYDINETVYSFANARYEDDEFSAYHYQKNLTLGLGWHAIKNDNTKLDFELGAGGQEDKLRATGKKNSGAAGRFFEDFSHKLTESTDFTQSLLVEGNSDNAQSTFDAGLKVAINGSLALKLSHQVKHNSDVPTGTKNYSRISSATLVYGF